MAGSNALRKSTPNGVRKKTGPKGPWKMTELTVGKLRQAFAIDATVEEACFYAGINKTTYYEWKKINEELSNELEALRNTPILTARQTVVNAIKTDPDMALKYLERKRKVEFSTKTETDTTLHVVQPILAEVVKYNDSDANPDVIDLT